MEDSLKEVVLLTGCSKGGIGFALAEEFAAKGCRVFATARRLEAMVGLPELGIDTLTLDVTSQTSIQGAVREVVSKAGRIDILVNNAGVGLAGSAGEVSLDAVRQLFETNLFGALAMVQAVFPLMAARRRGKIVNVGSVAGYIYRPWNLPYTSSKAALHAATNVMRLEMKPLGIAVVLVAPGAIQSNIHGSVEDAVQPLPEGSPYKAAEASMKLMSRSMRESPKLTSAAVFAEHVVKKVLLRHPPWRIVIGQHSMLAMALSFLPVPLQDWILWRKFGCQALEADSGDQSKYDVNRRLLQ